MEAAEDDVPGQRLAYFPVPHWHWHWHITPESQRTPWQALDYIRTTVKVKDHYWHFQDKLLSAICQLPKDGIHALNTCITTLISQCKFPHPETQEMLKVMVLQHAVPYHKERDWITGYASKTSPSSPTRLFSPTVSSFQKVKEKDQADLTSLTAATTAASSIHTNALSTFPRCNKCGYSYPPNKCFAQERML